MVSAVLRKTGNILLVLCVLIPLPLSAYEITTGIEPSSVVEGESATLSVSISGSNGDAGPSRIPDVQGLSIQYSGIQHSYQYVNGKSWRGMVLNYTVTGMKTGSYVVPSFPVKIGGREVFTQPVKLSVLGAGSGSMSGQQYGSAVRVAPRVEISKNRLYAGEPLLLRYYIVSNAGANVKIKGFEENPAASGCIMKPVDETLEDKVVSADGADAVREHIQTYIVIPAQTGRIAIGGGSIVAVADNRMDFFSFERPFRIEFDKQPVDVLPLPAGSPSDFSGTVGRFSLNAQYDDAPVKTYQDKKITVTVRGTGNMVSMSQPVLKTPEQVQLLVAQTSESMKPSANSLEGERQYTFTVIPREAGTFNLGKITLSYFDPHAGRYLVASSDEIKLTAEPGGVETTRDRGQSAPASPNYNWILYSVVGIIISGTLAAIYMLLGREKIKSLLAKRTEIKPDVEDGQGHVQQVTLSVDVLRELAVLEKKDEFLKEASRLVELRLQKETPGRNRYQGLKDELSRFRFGGGLITRGDMEHIINELAD